MQVNQAYVQAVKDWVEQEKVEVPERAIEFLAQRVTDAAQAVRVVQGKTEVPISERTAIYLTAQQRVSNFLEQLPNLSNQEASLLGRTIERVNLGEYSKDYTLLFGARDAGLALEKAKEPEPVAISQAQIDEAKRAPLRMLEAYLAKTPVDHPMYAPMKAQIEKTKKELGLS